MEELQVILLTCWGGVTAVLVVLVIYRSTLSTREDDQIFIDAAEQHYFKEQQEIIAKMSSLAKPILALALISAALLLTSAGMWVYAGLKGF